MSETALYMWVVYKDPKDAPPGYPFMVRARRITAGKDEPCAEARAAKTLELARSCIPPGKVMLSRHPDDDPVIVEVWL